MKPPAIRSSRSLLPLTPTLPPPLPPPYHLPCHQRGAASVQLQHPYCLLLPSHPFLPSRPIASPPSPSNTPQINTGLITEGGDAEHIARSAGRKEKAVCHCSISRSLSFFLCFYLALLCFFSHSVSSSTQTAKPQQQLLPFLLFFFSLSLSLTSRCVYLGTGWRVGGFSPLPSRRMVSLSLCLSFSTKQFFIICTACVNSAEKQCTGGKKNNNAIW